MGIRYVNKAQFFKRLNSVAPKAQEEIGKANQKSADQLVALMQSLVAVKTGVLRDSIRQEQGTKSPTAILVMAGGPTTTNASGYDRANAIEFGTEDQPRQPFFYVSVRRVRKPARSRAIRALKKAVKESGFGGG